MLSDHYVSEERYPHLDAASRAEEWRVPLLLAGVRRLIDEHDLAVLGLQEVDGAVARELSTFGHVQWAPRPGSAEGCAIVVVPPHVVASATVLRFPDPTEHLAQRVAIRHEGGAVVVYNTHLMWTADGLVGRDQAAHLAEWVAAERSPVVVLGDLNSPPGSIAVGHLLATGCTDAHSSCGDFPTASFEGVGPVRVDYVLVRGGTASPVRPAPVDGPLPSATNPSDHVPLVARFEFSGG